MHQQLHHKRPHSQHMDAARRERLSRRLRSSTPGAMSMWHCVDCLSLPISTRVAQISYGMVCRRHSSCTAAACCLCHCVMQVMYCLPCGDDPGDALLSECGAMNLFFVFKRSSSSAHSSGGSDGITQIEVVTPPLDGTILPGVTRDSALQLLRGCVIMRVILCVITCVILSLWLNPKPCDHAAALQTIRRPCLRAAAACARAAGSKRRRAAGRGVWLRHSMCCTACWSHSHTGWRGAGAAARRRGCCHNTRCRQQYWHCCVAAGPTHCHPAWAGA